jgi:hypothetical protein
MGRDDSGPVHSPAADRNPTQGGTKAQVFTHARNVVPSLAEVRTKGRDSRTFQVAYMIYETYILLTNTDIYMLICMIYK